LRSFLPQKLVAGKEGQMLRVTIAVGNRGGAKSDPFFTGIYLSTDPEITRDDYQIGWIGMQIEPRGEASVASSIRFPTDIPAGVYYVGWLIDAEDTVREEHENNNMAVIESAQLTLTAP
jgi:subtilase family serine protease